MIEARDETKLDETKLQNAFRRSLREGHFLAVSPALRPLALALYRRLAAGRAVTASDLGTDLGLPSEAVGARLDKVPASTMDVDPDGAIVAFGGLSMVPARHLFRLQERDLYTWCVFDALFLPQLLDRAALCITDCPASGQQIEIQLSPQGLIASRPEAPVMSLVAPQRTAYRADLRGAFCNHVNFFADETAFRAWRGERSDVGSISLDRAQQLARQRNQHFFGDLLNTTAPSEQGDIE